MHSMMRGSNYASPTRASGSDTVGTRLEAVVSRVSRTSGYVTLIMGLVGLVGLFTNIL